MWDLWRLQDDEMHAIAIVLAVDRIAAAMLVAFHAAAPAVDSIAAASSDSIAFHTAAAAMLVLAIDSIAATAAVDSIAATATRW
jgi:hypothetical protein